MNDSSIPFNSHARYAITQHADNAEKDLAAARKAYTDQFGTGAGARSAATAPSARATTGTKTSSGPPLM